MDPPKGGRPKMSTDALLEAIRSPHKLKRVDPALQRDRSVPLGVGAIKDAGEVPLSSVVGMQSSTLEAIRQRYPSWPERQVDPSGAGGTSGDILQVLEP